MRHLGKPFTVRRLMSCVAAVALLAWPFSLVVKREGYRRRFEQHEQTAQVLSSEIVALRKQCGQEREARLREAVMVEESRVAGVYLRAMQHPWDGPDFGEGEPGPPKIRRVTAQ